MDKKEIIKSNPPPMCGDVKEIIKELKEKTNELIEKETTLKDYIEEEITKTFEGILEYCQVVCPSVYVYKVLRSKLLLLENNCIRNLLARVEK